MKLKNIFKKNPKSVDLSNFKSLDKTQSQKIAGGASGDTTQPTDPSLSTSGMASGKRQHQPLV
jgi:hypothetical protein